MTDGEVESFKLIPVKQVAEIIRKTQFFKPNCAIVIIDFLFRHGYFFLFPHHFIHFLPYFGIYMVFATYEICV